MLAVARARLSILLSHNPLRCFLLLHPNILTDSLLKSFLKFRRCNKSIEISTCPALIQTTIDMQINLFKIMRNILNSPLT